MSADTETNVALADPVVRTPARLSSVAAVALLAVAVGLVTPSETAASLVVAVVGALFVFGGRELYRRRRGVAVLLGLLGVGTAVAAVAVGVLRTAEPSGLLRLVPGLVGVFVVGLALAPARRGWSRGLLKVGTALALASVLVCGVLRQAGYGTLAASTVAVVAAWDLGENAVGIGEQLGRDAETAAIQTTHAVATGLVGAAALFAGDVARGVGTGGLSLPALALVLLALVLFSAALFD